MTSQGTGMILDDEGRSLATVDYRLSVSPQFDEGIPVSTKTTGRILGPALAPSMLRGWLQSMQRVTLQLADKRKIKIFIVDENGSFRAVGEFF